MGRAIRKLQRIRQGIAAEGWNMLPAILAEELKLIDLSFVSSAGLGLSGEDGYHHSSSLGYGLRRILRNVGVSSTDTILDLGCGKGGAIIALSAFPFRRIDGLDISQDLIDIARRNLSRLRINRGELHCCNATEFSDLDDYTHIFIYNPFPGKVMAVVLNNLAASFRRRPRRFVLIYRNPTCDDLIAGTDLFATVMEFNEEGNSHTHVYIHDAATADWRSQLP